MARDLAGIVTRAKRDYQQKELERLGLTPEDEQHEQIVGFFSYLHDEAGKSSILPEPDENGNYFVKYFCDSIQPLLLFGFKVEGSLLDINGGVGFPAIPTAIFRPDLNVTIVEPDSDKFAFLAEMVEDLKITNVTVIKDVETLGDSTFDYVVQRGIETLTEFTRVGKKYVDRDGRLYTFRTENFEEELSEITMNKEDEGVCVSEIAEYDLANKIYGLNLVAFELY